MKTGFTIFTKRRHICSTPGCREKDTYRIARTNGASGVLFLCEKCINDAYEAKKKSLAKGKE